MNKLATKHTRKKGNYNTKHVAKKLDTLASNVAKRGVYIVKKTNIGFDIINYISKSVIVSDIPFSHTAKSFCDRLNKEKGLVSSVELKRHIDMYHKHTNDILFYKHTIRTSVDPSKVFTAGVRMQDSLGMVKEAKIHLSYF